MIAIILVTFISTSLTSFVNSGCFFMPIEKTCIDKSKISWSYQDDIKNLNLHLKSFNTSYGEYNKENKDVLSRDDWIKNFNWLKYHISSERFLKPLAKTLTIILLIFLIFAFKYRLKIEKLVMYGPSMGGIGAIHYGLKFKADCIIAIDPNPINFNYQELVQNIKEYDPEDSYKTKFYINYTFDDEDFERKPEWTEEIINELQKKNVLLTIQPFCSNKHLEFIPSKDYLFNIIELMLYIDVSAYKQSKEWV